MKTVRISLNSIDKVKSFVNELVKFTDVDFDLVSGRYVIDAKSIMGIFSLDLSTPIDLNIHADAGRMDEIVNALTGTVEEVINAPCNGKIITVRQYPIVYHGALMYRILKDKNV